MKDQAEVGGGRSLLSTGRWATERIMAAMQAGRSISPAELRTNTTLRKDEWKVIDDAVIEEGVMRLRGIAELQAAGLTQTVTSAMGKTLFEFEKVTDVNDAIVSMSGIARSTDDRPDFSLDAIPLPIIHKDWDLDLRHLQASRNKGESLDSMQNRVAGRKVAERLEKILFAGYDGKFGGYTVYGFLNHPNTNAVTFGTNGAWDAAAKTGADIMADVVSMVKKLEEDKFFGPYWLYIPSAYDVVLDNDFKANSDLTIRQRLLQMNRVQRITTCDQLTAANVVLFQPTRDVVVILDGEPLQSVQWDVEGGFLVKFKAFTIQIPLIRATQAGACGVCKLSA